MALDTVHNYYERRVFTYIQDNYLDSGLSENQLADMACIALNRIPPRYIRHDIDMSFYLSSQEHHQMHKLIEKAVKKAYKKVRKLDGLDSAENEKTT